MCITKFAYNTYVIKKMSLFKIRDWCSTQLGDGREEFGFGSICVANLLSESQKGSEQIVLGSFSGLLRLFNVGIKQQQQQGEDNNGQTLAVSMGAIKPEHLLLEKQLEAPILQLAAGRFFSGSEKLYLAVLHPKKLAVYSFKATASGKMEYSDQYDVHLAYEHILARFAYNFTYGPFGGVKDRDFFCIQSLDCTVSFYEEENFAFNRFLPGSLLPGPLVYVSKTDSFVTVSSNWQVESYKYQVLAVATDSKSKEEAASLTTGKRVAMDWCYNIGENSVDIAFVDLSPAPASILILGERNIFCLSESGTLRFMKKLDYNPACFLVYRSTSEGYIQYMVATNTKTLLLYADSTLKWTAQLNSVPVCINIMGTGLLKGMIVTLSDDGMLSCGYLGTDPAFYGIPVQDTRNVDYYQKQKEFKKLQSLIKNSNQNIEISNKQNVKLEELSLTCVVPSKLDEVSLAYDTHVEDTVPSITVRVLLSAKLPLDNVQIFINTPSVIVAQSNAFYLSSLIGSEEIPVTFFLKHSFVPSHLIVRVRAVYSTGGGGSKSIRGQFQLPLQLFAKSCPSVKTSTYKITVDSSKPIVNLNDLFPDFSQSGSDGAALGFVLYGTVLPPLRKQKERAKELLTQKCAQFRTVERQLLIKLRDDTPTPLSHLDELAETTYRQLASLSNVIIDIDSALQGVCSSLSAATYLNIYLMKLLYNMSISEFDMLTKSFCPDVDEQFEQIWEEQVDTAITHLLQAMSSKGGNSSGGGSSSFSEQEMQRLGDSTRFKKHVTLLCDKLAKGVKLIVDDEKSKQQNNVNQKKKNLVKLKDSTDTSRVDFTDSHMGDGELPQGSTFGDIAVVNANYRQLSNIVEEGEEEFGGGSVGGSSSYVGGAADESEQPIGTPEKVSNAFSNGKVIPEDEDVVVETPIREEPPKREKLKRVVEEDRLSTGRDDVNDTNDKEDRDMMSADDILNSL